MDARRKWLICILLVGVTFALYWQAGRHEFIDFDDPQFITENGEIKGGLNWRSIVYAFSTPVVGNWHPLTTLSHILDCQLFGLNPGGHHLVSAAIHSINAALLFLALTTLTRRTWPSAAVAALFALHPLRVESVAWIAERKDVLSGFFFFLTLWAYGRFAKRRLQNTEYRMAEAGRIQCSDFEVQEAVADASRAEGRGSTLFYSLSLVFFACGLMSKPMVVTAPFVLLLLDLWPLRRMKSQSGRFSFGRFKTALIEKIPFFILSAASGAVTLAFQRVAVAGNSGVSLRARVENAIESYWRYLGKLFWPTKLAIIYPHPAAPYAAAERWPAWDIWLGAAVLAAITVGAILLLRSRPYVAAGWLWFLGTMVPVIGLVQVGEQAMADRYTYIPLIGPIISLVWLISDFAWPAAVRRFVLPTATCFVAASCAIVTYVQLSYWTDTVALFQHAVNVTGPNPAAEFSVGVGLEKKGDLEGAKKHYERTIELNPLDQQAHYNLGQLFRKEENWQAAANEYAATLRSNPNHIEAMLNLANVLPHLNRQTEAAIVLEQALRLQPDSIEALNNLAWILATSPDPNLRNGIRALQLAERACKLTNFGETALVGTLAAAYAESGRFADAVAAGEKACALAERSGQSELLKRNKELLELYKQGKAYHEGEHH